MKQPNRQKKKIKKVVDKVHSEETKEKMRKPKNIGNNNSQFGTCWIHNETENKKIKKDDIDHYMSLGYTKGRKMNLYEYWEMVQR